MWHNSRRLQVQLYRLQSTHTLQKGQTITSNVIGLCLGLVVGEWALTIL